MDNCHYKYRTHNVSWVCSRFYKQQANVTWPDKIVLWHYPLGQVCKFIFSVKVVQITLYKFLYQISIGQENHLLRVRKRLRICSNPWSHQTLLWRRHRFFAHHSSPPCRRHGLGYDVVEGCGSRGSDLRTGAAVQSHKLKIYNMLSNISENYDTEHHKNQIHQNTRLFSVQILNGSGDLPDLMKFGKRVLISYNIPKSN